MTRDWLLTLLALSSYFLAATIVVIALTRKPTRPERIRPSAESSLPRVGADRAGRGTR
jgi:hypothetical protein